MQSDFLAKVHTMYNQFTKAEKKVADFILQNVPFLPDYGGERLSGI